MLDLRLLQNGNVFGENVAVHQQVGEKLGRP